MIKIVEEANNRAKLSIKNLNDATSKSIRRAFYDLGKDLTKEAKNLIDSKPKSGRTYIKRIGTKGQRLKKGISYIASAAGEAPAVVSGTLKRSLNFNVVGDKKLQVGIDLHYGAATYAKYLEYKNIISMTGRGSQKIAPRPFLSAAYNNKKAIFKDYFIKNLKYSVGNL